MRTRVLPSSFRDPSGFVFSKQNHFYRQVNICYKENYDFLINSGLYQSLVNKKLLISHAETELPLTNSGYKILKPEQIPFISYSYEWSFSQLKDAALLTLSVQQTALEFGMSLKDASSFNIQFIDGKPIFIDTLSFERYKQDKPWVAYKQFCENFLAPLALSAYCDVRLNKLLQDNLGSFPIELAAKLLPQRTKLKMGLLFHIFLHANSQKKNLDTKIKNKKTKPLKKRNLVAIIESLKETIHDLKIDKGKTVWTDYYQTDHPSYKNKDFEKKKDLVQEYLKTAGTKALWDIGANTGVFSKLATSMGIFTVSLDNDHSVIERIYIEQKKEKLKNLLPLWIDIANPTPAIGWNGRERDSILNRPLPDTVLALAVIHHLAINNNLPLSHLAGFFAKICNKLIIEFVPKSDPQVKTLLQNREDVFPDYNKETFEKELNKYFYIKTQSVLTKTNRILYLFSK